MLLGRDSEQRAIEELLERAREGRSGALALVGEAGIGKTALLDAAAGAAGGMLVLRARGVEAEAGVPFAGLLELLRPGLGVLDRIPAPQATALGAALALRPGGGGDRFAVGAATLSLLAAVAEEAPVLVLVDDAQWLDRPTAEALRFAIRRLLADPVAVVLAVREGEPSLLDGADLPQLVVGGLDPEAAAALLADAAGPPAAARATALHAATAGNPLALLELAAGAAGDPGAVPVPVSERLAEAFGRRAAGLGEPARRALVLAAAGGGGELGVLASAGAALGVDVGALAAAEAEGLVRVHAGSVEFRHPLVRSAVYGRAGADERRAAHRALAGALPDRDADRRAWHLAAAALGPDEAASAALAQAGGRAMGRAAYAVAADAYERAARLAPAEPDRAALLCEAAEAAWLGGAAERAEALAEEVETPAAPPALAVRAAHLRGRLVLRRGPVRDGYALLVDAADRAIAANQPEVAVVALAEAVSAGFYAGDAPSMLRAARRAAAIASGVHVGEASAFLIDTTQGMALVWSGRAREGIAALRRGVERLEGSPALQANPQLQSWAMLGRLWLRDTASGRALADGMLARAREQAAVGVMPALLHYVARDHATSDRWDQAYAVYDEAARLSREVGQRAELASALSGLAWLEARGGREADCRAHAEEARALCVALGSATFELWVVAALADLELGLGRPAAALERLVELRDLRDRLQFDDADLSPGPELVDAHLRLGDAAAAQQALDGFEAEAERKGRPWALARAARCRGLLAGDGDFDAHFADALRLHAETPDGFETARTRLAYGARLRRARRRADAREHLRVALDAFERLGAAPWADQASGELAATGETARRRVPSTLDDLTPQELQIAHLLAEGRTTREAAAALFLSPKTIEHHLRSVYRKLGINSRPALAEALACKK